MILLDNNVFFLFLFVVFSVFMKAQIVGPPTTKGWTTLE
jgi:hypothetical protein